jgi:hypothetical protein
MVAKTQSSVCTQARGMQVKGCVRIQHQSFMFTLLEMKLL